MNIKVSIIIPTYKRASFLERAVNSVLNQTHSCVEIIVVDDNSSLNHRVMTERTMKKFLGNTKVVYLQNKTSLGGALARNEGIKIATGDYITFLDDDDIYLNEKIESQLNYMLENNLDFSFTDVRIHNKKDILVDYREHPYVISLNNQELLKQHIMHHLTPTATYMFKKEPLNAIGGFDDVKMGQEFMLMLKAIENNFNIGYLPIAEVIQYLHDEERISVGQNKINKEEELYKFKEKYFNVLTPKEVKYVKFRHHAVLFVVGIRSKKYFLAANNFLNAIITSPIECIKLSLNQVKKIHKFN